MEVDGQRGAWAEPQAAVHVGTTATCSRVSQRAIIVIAGVGIL